jgi:hypothetical protein
MRRTKVQTYFRPVEKKSLAEPVDFFHHNGLKVRRASTPRWVCVLLPCGRALGHSKGARLINRDECTWDREAVAYTRSVL